MDRRAHLFIA